MCGIAGIVSLDGSSVPLGDVERMLDHLGHRGPDERGTWKSEGVVLGHTRLSIIDTEGSHQPFVVDDTTATVYNGEIFNFKELRHELDGPWNTQGDTEVMERLLARRGTSALERVHGQFAVGRWEGGARRLTLARDALGVLPLFWWADEQRFVFASEIPALLAGIGTRPSIDRHGLSLYLGYRAVPAPRTLWEGVHKLPPGHALSLAPGHAPRLVDWRPPAPEPDATIGFEEAVNQLRHTLTRSVELSLVADVPVGSYLSGGLDSSLIAALAQRQRDEPLRTYCAMFGDPDTDESPWARMVAKHLGTTHTDVLVQAGDFLSEWPRLSLLRGAPVSEPADVAVNHLAMRASEDVKVVLSGEGSDELFAGYPKHRLAQLTRHIGRLPAAVRGPLLTSVADRLPTRGRRLAVAVDALAQPDEESRIRTWFASFTPRDRRHLLGHAYAEQELSTSIEVHPLVRMLRHDQGAWLADNLLERGDRMTMGASVELRPPFLDPAVVHLARRLPPGVLLHQGKPKAVVKGLAADLLPGQILSRPKSGFRVPLQRWLREDMRPEVLDMLSQDSFVGSQLDRREVSRLVNGHLDGSRDESIRLWTLLSLEVWWRTVS